MPSLAPPSHTRPTSLKTFLFGSAYYPEHWDEATRHGDPALFRAAGWNVVRMGEFAWNYFEPQPGRFCFELFDETIARFAEAGIRTILCTPTATPPRWLTAAHPEIVGRSADGRDLAHGSRQHASLHHHIFREHSRRITAALAAHYAGNPHVIGWQTHNEFHCEFSEDHSPAAVAGFVAFLRARYGENIDALNAAWGTAFWAQSYGEFDEISTPRSHRPTAINPSQALDYARYISATVASFQREQIDLLRAADARWFVTHNGVFPFIDYAGTFGCDLDFLGYDCYPFFERDPAKRAAVQAASLDLARAWSGNIVVMEQQCGAGGQTSGNILGAGDSFMLDTPEPGELRRMAYTSIARGADGLLLFRERSCRFGAEQYWCGVLDHDNVPRRRYREAAHLGAELARVGPAVAGTAVQIEIGIAACAFDSDHAHFSSSLGLPSPRVVAETVHGFFFKRGHAVGFVRPDDDLRGLRVYVVPHLAVFDPAWCAALEAFVDAGGWLIVGARSGTKDLHNHVVAQTPPGVLRALVGASVEEYGHQNAGDLRPLPLLVGGIILPTTEHWYELLQPDAGTETIGEWRGRHLHSHAGITLKRQCRGAVVYVGTYFTASLLEALLPVVAKEMGAAFPVPLTRTRGVEVVVRRSAERSVRFVINHSEDPVEFITPAAARNLIDERVLGAGDSVRLVPNDVAVLDESPTPPARGAG